MKEIKEAKEVISEMIKARQGEQGNVVDALQTALAALKTIQKINPDFCYEGKEILLQFNTFKKEAS